MPQNEARVRSLAAHAVGANKAVAYYYGSPPYSNQSKNCDKKYTYRTECIWKTGQTVLNFLSNSSELLNGKQEIDH